MNWEAFTFVHWQAQKWSGFYIRINDRLILPHNNIQYYALQNIRHCVLSNSDSQDSGFCARDCFGCRQLRSINRLIGSGCWDYQIWYRYGYFSDNARIWHVDRKAILGQLMYEAKESLMLYCPEFSPERLSESVYELPEQIVLDEFWEVEYDVRLGERGLVNVPVNVRCLHELHNVDHVVNTARVTGRPDAKDEDEVNRYLDELLKKKKPE